MFRFGSIRYPVTIGEALPCHGLATAPIEHCRFQVAFSPVRVISKQDFVFWALDTWIILFSSSFMSDNEDLEAPSPQDGGSSSHNAAQLRTPVELESSEAGDSSNDELPIKK
jgi:hypothetical protein